MFFLQSGETWIGAQKLTKNHRSEELLKLRRGQKILIFRGGGGLPSGFDN